MKTESPEVCQHIAIAHCAAGHITICPECNVVHVTLEHLTLRFSPEIFRTVTHLFGSAQARLDHAGETLAPAVAEVAGKGGPRLH